MAITSIKIEYDDAIQVRLIRALAIHFNYEASIPDPAGPPFHYIPNPEGKAAFVKRRIAETIRNAAVAVELREAEETAAAAAAEAAKTIILT